MIVAFYSISILSTDTLCFIILLKHFIRLSMSMRALHLQNAISFTRAENGNVFSSKKEARSSMEIL